MFLRITLIVLAAVANLALAADPAITGVASWCGEEHRGKLMANGQPFNPDELTAASWFFPLGTKVLVSFASAAGVTNSVAVTVTDRGPARRLVYNEGRIIDLSLSAFKTLAQPSLGLIRVRVKRVVDDPHERAED